MEEKDFWQWVRKSKDMTDKDAKEYINQHFDRSELTGTATVVLNKQFNFILDRLLPYAAKMADLSVEDLREKINIRFSEEPSIGAIVVTDSRMNSSINIYLGLGLYIYRMISLFMIVINALNTKTFEMQKHKILRLQDEMCSAFWDNVFFKRHFPDWERPTGDTWIITSSFIEYATHFIIAHELGHIVQHRSKNQPVPFSDLKDYLKNYMLNPVRADLKNVELFHWFDVNNVITHQHELIPPEQTQGIHRFDVNNEHWLKEFAADVIGIKLMADCYHSDDIRDTQLIFSGADLFFCARHVLEEFHLIKKGVFPLNDTHPPAIFRMQILRFADRVLSKNNTLELSNPGEAMFHLLTTQFLPTERAIQIKPDDAEAWYNNGVALYKLNRLEEALAAFERAIQIKPDSAEAWHYKGGALGQLNRPEEALVAFEQAVQIKPSDAETWYNKGVVLGQLNRPEGALVAYERAIQINPNYVEAWHNKGTVLLKLNRPEEALTAFERTIQIRPDRAAWNGKGAALARLNRLKEAQIAFMRAYNPQPSGLEEALLDFMRLDASIDNKPPHSLEEYRQAKKDI